jgi:hypothetical protein
MACRRSGVRVPFGPLSFFRELPRGFFCKIFNDIIPLAFKAIDQAFIALMQSTLVLVQQGGLEIPCLM